MRVGNLIKQRDVENAEIYLIVDNLSYHEAGGTLIKPYLKLRYWKLINQNGVSELLLTSCENLYEVVL